MIPRTWRSWQNAKGVALLAVAALAVGIGSTTAIYTVVHTVLLKPLPYREGERFVALYAASFAEPGVSSLNYPDVVEFARRTHSFDVFGWFRNDQFNLTSPGQPEHIGGIDLTAGLANSLGVNPVAGRWFRDEDGYAVAVISSALAERLGGRAKILGQAITLNSRQYTVLGVMPPWFRLPAGGQSQLGHLFYLRAAQAWRNLRGRPSRRKSRRRANCQTVSRRPPGVYGGTG
jgi:putative ABC transport system permease protein